MLRFILDENFNLHIASGVVRRLPTVDMVRVQDAGLTGADDPTVLEWAARAGPSCSLTMSTRSPLSLTTVSRKACGCPVFEISLKVPISAAIEDILLLASCSLEGEWEGQVNYLPLR